NTVAEGALLPDAAKCSSRVADIAGAWSENVRAEIRKYLGPIARALRTIFTTATINAMQRFGSAIVKFVEVRIERAVKIAFKHEQRAIAGILMQHQAREVKKPKGRERYVAVAGYVFPNFIYKRTKFVDLVLPYFR